jgi:Zn-dependent protease with chaperone function
MVAKRTRGKRLSSMTLVLALTGLMGGMEARPAERAPTPTSRRAWPLVHIQAPVARRALTDALDDAAARLATPACTRILTDFAAVTPNLTDTLDSLDTPIERHLAMVVFIDESRHRLCLGTSLAFTTPGSRVVRVCSNELLRQSLTRDQLAAMVIHEVLHTLGLPENPPSSREITRRVLARCGNTR